MKLFLDCSGPCCTCACVKYCIAGYGDDDYSPASKNEIIERLNKCEFLSDRQTMIKYLKDKYNYEYSNNLKNRLFHPYDSRSLFKRLFGYCDCPYHKRHWFIYPKTIRQNTRYADEINNWITCCEEFYENEIEPYWEERWSEYYSSRL